MTVCVQTLQMSSRTVQGTLSVELAETGMEEALWALNKDDWSTWSISGTTATKTLSGFTFDGNVTGQVNLTITSYNGSAGTRAITVSGTTQNPVGTSVTRTLTSSSDKAPLFVNAIAATNNIVQFTSGGTVDSWDSTLGSYGSQTPTYSAIIASDLTPSGSATVQLTNANVKGYVASLYGSGPSYSSGATLKGPSTPGTTKIDSARISSSPYQPIFTIKTISGAGTVLSNPSNGSTTILGTPGATSPSIYYSTGLNLTSSTKIIINGPVQIVVSGSFYVGLYGGSPQIEVTNSGTLEVFAAGDIAIYGNGIDNKSKDPSRTIIYGTNTLTVPDMNTSMEYYGVIYTPNGYFSILGNTKIYGAIVAKKVKFSGSNPEIHYDLNLRNKVFSGVDTPYAVSDWRETSSGT